MEGQGQTPQPSRSWAPWQPSARGFQLLKVEVGRVRRDELTEMIAWAFFYKKLEDLDADEASSET